MTWCGESCLESINNSNVIRIDCVHLLITCTHQKWNIYIMSWFSVLTSTHKHASDWSSLEFVRYINSVIIIIIIFLSIIRYMIMRWPRPRNTFFSGSHLLQSTFCSVLVYHLRYTCIHCKPVSGTALCKRISFSLFDQTCETVWGVCNCQ